MTGRALRQRATNAVREELLAFDARRHLVTPLAHVLPPEVGNRVRVRLLRAAGLSIGPGTTIAGRLTVLGAGARRHLRIGEGCFINAGCTIDASAPVEIGARARLGHEVLLLTNSHELGRSEQRAGSLIAAPITIGPGAWLGSRCVVLPGVRVGAGAVVAAGSVVTADVPDDVLAAGVPAALKRRLEGPIG